MTIGLRSPAHIDGSITRSCKSKPKLSSKLLLLLRHNPRILTKKDMNFTFPNRPHRRQLNCIETAGDHIVRFKRRLPLEQKTIGSNMLKEM